MTPAGEMDALLSLDPTHARISNGLLEAIVAAPFGRPELRIVLTILRLTYGWRRRSVNLTELELADAAGYLPRWRKRASLRFREALARLVEANVVFSVRATLTPARRRGLRTYALNKHPTAWGKYAVPRSQRYLTDWSLRPMHSWVDEERIRQFLAEHAPPNARPHRVGVSGGKGVDKTGPRKKVRGAE